MGRMLDMHTHRNLAFICCHKKTVFDGINPYYISKLKPTWNQKVQHDQPIQESGCICMEAGRQNL